MRRISVLVVVVVIALWAGCVMAQSVAWPSKDAGHNFAWEVTTNLNLSSYWLGQQQITPQPVGKWNWVDDQADNDIVEARYYLQFWPRDNRWHEMDNNKIIVKNFFETNPIPEPATMLLLGVGLVGLARTRVKSNRK